VSVSLDGIPSLTRRAFEVAKTMDYVPLISGYLLLTLAFMFGGRERRAFNVASHAAAATLITLLCLASLLWFIGNTLRHLTTH
jgi:hypothetical protein